MPDFEPVLLRRVGKPDSQALSTYRADGGYRALEKALNEMDADTLCKRLNVEPGGTTADGKITLEFAECLGACEGAPAVMVNDEHRHNVTPEAAQQIVAELRT